MRAFDDLVRAGKVLYVGISDSPAWVVAQSNTLAELSGWTRYVGLQIEYSLLEHTVERELIPMAGNQGLTVLAWGPLRGGLLTGKYLAAGADHAAGADARFNSAMMKGGDTLDEAGTQTVREVVALAMIRSPSAPGCVLIQTSSASMSLSLSSRLNPFSNPTKVWPPPPEPRTSGKISA